MLKVKGVNMKGFSLVKNGIIWLVYIYKNLLVYDVKNKNSIKLLDII